MKNLFSKIKELFSKNDVKASFWSTTIIVILFIPFIIVFITLLSQYSYITTQFWLFIYLAILFFVLLYSFSAVLYQKLMANYENEKLSRKEYGKTYVKELFSPFCVCFLIVTTIIYLDQITKNYANLHLVEGVATKFIPHIINWRLAFNTGAAWSMFSSHTNILAIISLVASLVILFFLRNFDLKKRPLYSIALSFIFGGTVGNMIDRFFYSKGVIDFIDLAFMDYPTFNIADSFLVVGTILLATYFIFDMIKEDKNKKAKLDEKTVTISEEEKND